MREAVRQNLGLQATKSLSVFSEHDDPRKGRWFSVDLKHALTANQCRELASMDHDRPTHRSYNEKEIGALIQRATALHEEATGSSQHNHALSIE